MGKMTMLVSGNSTTHHPAIALTGILAALLVVPISPRTATAQNAKPIPQQAPKVLPTLADVPTPGAPKKTAPPSPSNPKSKKKVTKLYQASSQETADSILADTLNLVIHQGDEHFHEGEWNHTLNLGKIAVQGDPHNMDVYCNNAYLLWSLARNSEADEILKAGVKANPDTYYMYDEAGNHYLLFRRDAVAALPYFEQAVKFKVPTFTTWQNLGRCYEKTNQWDKAVEAWRKATLYPDALKAEFNLKRVMAERDKRNQK